MKLRDSPFEAVAEIPHYPMKREGSLVESVRAHIKYKTKLYGVDREDSSYPLDCAHSNAHAQKAKRRRLDPLDKPRMRIENMQPSWEAAGTILTPRGSNPNGTETVFGHSFKPGKQLSKTDKQVKPYHLPPIQRGGRKNSVGRIDEELANTARSGTPVVVVPTADSSVVTTALTSSTHTVVHDSKKRNCLCHDCLDKRHKVGKA